MSETRSGEHVSAQIGKMGVIDELKQQLSATDYKVIKYYEFVIADDNCEAYADYEMKKLHEERQAIRAEINRLEAML